MKRALNDANFTAALASIDYYTRENCQSLGYLPDWTKQTYKGETHFEKLFGTPLTIDLMASAHSGQESGFEQVTADWGCDFAPTYGTGTNSIGFYGPGAKDPAGGGCPRGPVRVYEDLTCAIKLGLKSNPSAFKKFCGEDDGGAKSWFECLAFFGNVLTETGAFAETEERDPRPYCWNRENGDKTQCCPADDHKPCLADSSNALNPSDYPSKNSLWLGNSEEQGKCCSYHGRGFLQVSYEPNYKVLSKALLGDERVLWHYPYKLDADGVMGWSSALWYWFNTHEATVATEENGEIVVGSPRSELFKYKEGSGMPGTIAAINGAECMGEMDTTKARQRVGLMFTIAQRLKAPVILEQGDPPLDRWPLPGTADCEKNTWCRSQFHNGSSICPVFSSGFSCMHELPYIQNISTPMGWDRRAVKLTSVADATPQCNFGKTNKTTPEAWTQEQEPLEPIDQWWTMLDIHRENVCGYAKQKYSTDDVSYREGHSANCSTMCWKDFTDDTNAAGGTCEEPQKPCKTLSEYVSHPLPSTSWEEGGLTGYFGGRYYGRVGPGLVAALNKHGFGDKTDHLCQWFGASLCHWNISMGTSPAAADDIHGCRIYPPGVSESSIDADRVSDRPPYLLQTPGEKPPLLTKVMEYYARSNCPTPTGDTILERILPNGADDIDFLFAGVYSASDSFDNKRWDNLDDLASNHNAIGYSYGVGGPKALWDSLLCAYNIGIESDPDFIKRTLFRRTDGLSTDNLTEDDLKFAKLELISIFANVVKETGNFGQLEEQDPRAYCNHQGGEKNPCGENYWGNNPACPDRGDLTPEFMSAGLTPLATCASYHGRGLLQTSYEKNYGDLGEAMLYSPRLGISKEFGRKLLVNYPQAFDPFDVSGMTAALLFWVDKHPCQYCDGKESNTEDWNAAYHSPHEAMLAYDIPGEGFGKAINIINGMECEASMSGETDIAWFGSQMRLTFLYNLAYRLQVMAPGENTLLPLPGTKECDASPWCKGTFNPGPNAPFGRTSGGCWALTPQDSSGGKKVYPYCKLGSDDVQITTKYGVNLTVPNFSIAAQGGCTQLHTFKCGSKFIDPANKPSMKTDPDMKSYLNPLPSLDTYKDPDFKKFKTMTVDEICDLFYDSADKGVDCPTWCNHPSGGRTCMAIEMETCHINSSGLAFVNCVSKWLKNFPQSSTCRMDR